MSLLLKKLKGELNLDEAIEARLQAIRKIGSRRKFNFNATKQEGYTQVALHPENKK